MRFQIPQFIETEDKIIGPLTLKQFLYLAGAGAISFVLFFILRPFFWFLITAIVGVFGVAMAFVKINGIPFPKVFASAISFMSKPRLYLWHREQQQKIIELPEVDTSDNKKKGPKTAPAASNAAPAASNAASAASNAAPAASDTAGAAPGTTQPAPSTPPARGSINTLQDTLRSATTNVPRREPPLPRIQQAPPPNDAGGKRVFDTSLGATTPPIPPLKEGESEKADIERGGRSGEASSPAVRQGPAQEEEPGEPPSPPIATSWEDADERENKESTDQENERTREQEAPPSANKPPPPSTPPSQIEDDKEQGEQFEVIRMPGGKTAQAKRVDFD